MSHLLAVRNPHPDFLPPVLVSCCSYAAVNIPLCLPLLCLSVCLCVGHCLSHSCSLCTSQVRQQNESILHLLIANFSLYQNPILAFNARVVSLHYCMRSCVLQSRVSKRIWMNEWMNELINGGRDVNYDHHNNIIITCNIRKQTSAVSWDAWEMNGRLMASYVGNTQSIIKNIKIW